MSKDPYAAGSGRWHFRAVIAVTIVVMLLGILVVAAPEQMGVPRLPATPVATPVAATAPE